MSGESRYTVGILVGNFEVQFLIQSFCFFYMGIFHFQVSDSCSSNQAVDLSGLNLKEIIEKNEEK